MIENLIGWKSGAVFVAARDDGGELPPPPLLLLMLPPPPPPPLPSNDAPQCKAAVTAVGGTLFSSFFVVPIFSYFLLLSLSCAGWGHADMEGA